MLRYLLDGHPEINCKGEVFIRKGLLRFIFKNRRSFGLSPGYADLVKVFQAKPIEEFLSTDLLSTSNSNQKAVGFKFKTDEYFDSGYQEIAGYIRGHNDIKVIHLRRRDLLAQYVSYLFVQKKINPTVSFDTNLQRSSQQIVIERKPMLRYLTLVTERENKIEEDLNQHKIHEVWYEDLIKHKETSLGAIYAFLGVQNINTPVTTQKLILNYQDHIANLDEVQRWLEQGGFPNGNRSITTKPI